jgi:AraC family transcriptional regulator
VAGASPHQYLIRARLRRAAHDIAASDRRISEIAFAAGFGDLSTFNARFRATFAASPTAWRRAHRKAADRPWDSRR